MDSSAILMLMIGVAVGTYFHESVENVVPVLKNEGNKTSVQSPE